MHTPIQRTNEQTRTKTKGSTLGDPFDLSHLTEAWMSLTAPCQSRPSIRCCASATSRATLPRYKLRRKKNDIKKCCAWQSNNLIGSVGILWSTNSIPKQLNRKQQRTWFYSGISALYPPPSWEMWIAWFFIS